MFKELTTKVILDSIKLPNKENSAEQFKIEFRQHHSLAMSISFDI